MLHITYIKHTSTIATYPTTGVRVKSKSAFSKKKTRGSHHQHLFKENIRKKPKRCLKILKIRVQELFTHKVLTPHASVTRDDSL